MKALLILLASAWLLIAGGSNTLNLVWDNSPDYDTNTSFIVSVSTNAALPVAEWPLLTNVSFIDFTNAARPGEFGRVPIGFALFDFSYYVVRGSNVTGVSDFSDPVRVRQIRAGAGLQIR